MGASLTAEAPAGDRSESCRGDDPGLPPAGRGGGDAQHGDPDGSLLQVHLGADDPATDGDDDEITDGDLRTVDDEIRWMAGEVDLADQLYDDQPGRPTAEDGAGVAAAGFTASAWHCAASILGRVGLFRCRFRRRSGRAREGAACACGKGGPCSQGQCGTSGEAWQADDAEGPAGDSAAVHPRAQRGPCARSEPARSVDPLRPLPGARGVAPRREANPFRAYPELVALDPGLLG